VDIRGACQFVAGSVSSRCVRGLLTGESSTAPGASTLSLAYAYNANAHVSQQTYPDGLVISYAPDALGRASKVAGPSGPDYASGITYHPGGAIQSFTYGNGIVHTMTQNLRRLPARSQDLYTDPVSHVTTATLDDSYAFDENGNVDYVTDIAGTGNQNRSKDLGYDDLDRLIVADAPNQWGQATYAYDPMDNLRSADQGSRQYRYNYSTITNRLTDIKTPGGATVFGFTYDARGNTSSKSAQAYTFDSANRLSQVNNLETYFYDGLGRRVRTTDQGGAINYWIYSQGGQVMYAKLGRSGKWLNYIYLGNTQVAVRSVDNATSMVSVAYQHTDSLGSPVVETTAARVPTRHSYAPYGEAYGEPGGGRCDGTGYTGHVMDRATGLTYMQQRYYDPQVGRFLSVDPVVSSPANGGNFNRAWYANNNPYRYTDPDGRKPPGCGGGTCRPDEKKKKDPPKGCGVTRSCVRLQDGKWRNVASAREAQTLIQSAVAKYSVNTQGATVEYDPQIPSGGTTVGVGTIVVGPKAFGNLGQLAETISHEGEHVRQDAKGGNAASPSSEAAAYRAGLEKKDFFGLFPSDYQINVNLYKQYYQSLTPEQRAKVDAPFGGQFNE